MDLAVTNIDLPWPARVAASDGTTVWCSAAGRMRVYTASGAPLDGGEAVRLPELSSLAAVPATVPRTAGVPGTLPETVIVPRTFAGPPHLGSLSESPLRGTLAGTAQGRVHWLDPAGAPLATAPLSTGPLSTGPLSTGPLSTGPFDGRVLAGGGEIWAVGAERARRLTAPGDLGEPVELPGLDRCAVEGERLWWTSKRDTLVRGGPREVDLWTRERGGMTVCAGSLWISVAGGLERVSAWSGEPRRFVKLPKGPVPFLVCANGVLAGGERDLFVLDPAAGAAARVIRLGLKTRLAMVVAAGKHIWAFPADRPQALIVPL
ncbi:hypothetical protein ACFPOI_26565 [Nonomuraea angiospora]|uniref:Uncharacterized protein n=1 Tax=Nonomuraea angiospora TaxID=46172 RepID=A0ABR9LMD9_9ACTN|nr:hypothetical protein [Nonomuraea angiospora]MBE1581821.1 hypothetical protein [Nonomuraea angiospora]